MADSVTAGDDAVTRGEDAARPKSGFGSRLRDWLACRRELDALGAHGEPLDGRRAAAVRSGRDALYAARRLLDPIYPSPFGSDPAIAFSVLRDAIHWAVTAQAGAHPRTDERDDPTLEVALAGDDASLAALRSEALSGPPSARYLRSSAELRAEAPRVIAIVSALLDRADARAIATTRVHRKRALRRALAVALVLATLGALGGAMTSYARRNLLRGKPWTTSSVAYTCYPEARTCGGVATGIFFHTNEEPSPWISYDLGSATRFSRVHVRNRTDCCAERAVPLVLEVSDDGASFREIARRDEPFVDWIAKLGDQRARYVRLRAVHRTALHFEAVELR